MFYDSVYLCVRVWRERESEFNKNTILHVLKGKEDENKYVYYSKPDAEGGGGVWGLT